MGGWVNAVDEWVFGRVQPTNGFCVGETLRGRVRLEKKGRG